MLFVHYPKCTTCKKAQAWLDDRQSSYEARDIKLQNPTEDELRQWHAKSGLPLRRLFNTSGLQYKPLGLTEKVPTMSEDEKFTLLLLDGILLHLTILVGDVFVFFAFISAVISSQFS